MRSRPKVGYLFSHPIHAVEKDHWIFARRKRRCCQLPVQMYTQFSSSKTFQSSTIEVLPVQIDWKTRFTQQIFTMFSSILLSPELRAVRRATIDWLSDFTGP